MANNPALVCLGPMGDPDPTDLINFETNRIPFKLSSPNLPAWSQVFRSWPSVTPGWRNWYRRIASSMRVQWDELDIGQCLDLSLSDMNKNEPMLISASYFWSDALNAFLFGHGPMTPTLIDVLMLTGLNIMASD
jgi:hypothetical protein